MKWISPFPMWENCKSTQQTNDRRTTDRRTNGEKPNSCVVCYVWQHAELFILWGVIVINYTCLRVYKVFTIYNQAQLLGEVEHKSMPNVCHIKIFSSWIAVTFLEVWIEIWCFWKDIFVFLWIFDEVLSLALSIGTLVLRSNEIEISPSKL